MKLKDLVLLAKYFSYEGLTTQEIRNQLKLLCRKVDYTWNETTQDWKIKVALREMKKRTIRTAIPIPITVDEVEKIKKINDYALEKILFVLLVYGKILKYNNTRIKPKRKPVLLGLFYVNESSTNIFSVARVEVRKKQRNEMMHRLYDSGYIDATKYNGFLLKYVYENSPTAFMVEDYENIILYYQREKGEKISGCSCGRLFLAKTSRDGLCHKCKQEKRLIKKREWWTENRSFKTRQQEKPS